MAEAKSTLILIKSIIAVISIAEYWVFHQIDITSRHFAVAFRIPVQNISIYFDKLFSIRCLLIVVGYLIEYAIYQIGGGDRGGSNDGKFVRRYSSLVFFVFLFIARAIFLFVLYVSKQPSYHVYMALCFEALIFGANDSAYMALAAKYMSIISLFLNVSRLAVNLVQIILDWCFFNNPLLMIKIQSWVLVILSGGAVCLWYYYNLYLKDALESSNEASTETSNGHSEQIGQSGTQRIEVTPNHLDGPDALISPLVMFTVAYFVKDFLYPGTLPYALLNRDKCHTINKCMPFFNVIGPLVFFVIDNIIDRFKKWESFYNYVLILGIPLPIIVIYSFMAIHSHVPSAIAIRNSKPRVMTMTLVMTLCFGILDPLSYIGVAKYASRGNPYGYTIQTIFNLYSLISRSIVSRLSVGYNVIRVDLGYHLPKFRPKHRMSKSNLNWYIFRQTFKRSWTDVITDLQMDIEKYL